MIFVADGQLCNLRRCCPVTLIVGDNLNAVITEDTYARVGSSKIDTNRGCHDVDVYVWWGIKGKEKFVICSQVGDL
jgi:hypothetical protein